MSRKKFTERQRRFVEEFALNGNATQAAIRAGFSEKAASVQGSRLIANANIALAIRRRRAAASKRIEISADRVLNEYAKIAFNERKLPLTTTDRIRSLNALGKHLGLFVDKHEHDISARLQDTLNSIKSKMTPAAQQELLNAVGSAMAEGLVPGADAAADEPDGEAGPG